jgi:HAD superfamily hydrolase (TIGR01490 family)
VSKTPYRIPPGQGPRGPEEPPSGGAASSSAALVFFDLDGTLVKGQTQLLLIKFLRRVGVVSFGFLLGTVVWFLGYKAGLVKATDSTRRRGATMLRGLKEQEVKILMERFTEEELLPRLFPPAVAALQEHQAAGDSVVVVSAALEPLVQAFCARLGVGRYVGAPCELADGHYTGRVHGPIPYGEEKARVARQIADAAGVDLADCWAYGDHDTDLSLLESVGHPVAVRPRPLLRTRAEREGWPVLG